MSVTYISVALRRLVHARAQGHCEYCLLHESDAALHSEVDHVVAEKHGGKTVAGNLAYSCFLCNRSKGSDLGSLALDDGRFVFFFHPRKDVWGNHFVLDAAKPGVIVPLTATGEVTARILGFNTLPRIAERRVCQALGTYLLPTP